MVSINCSYHIDREGQGKYPPLVKNVYISDLTSEKSMYAIWLQGIEGYNCVENINIQNCTFSGVEEENQIDNVGSVTISHVLIKGTEVNAGLLSLAGATLVFPSQNLPYKKGRNQGIECLTPVPLIDRSKDLIITKL